MNNRIIICGFDSSGKSSIARALSLATGIPSFKDSMFKSDKYFGSWNYSNITGMILLDMVDQTKMEIILDRFVAPCEYAYSNALRKMISFYKLKYFDDRLYDMKFKFVYCFKTTYDNFKDDKTKVHDFSVIDNWYRKYFKFSKCECLILDTTNEDIKQQLVDIKLFLA